MAAAPEPAPRPAARPAAALPMPGAPAVRTGVPGPPPTLLPADGPDAEVAAMLRERVDPADAARLHPDSLLAWAVLADRALASSETGAGGDDVAAYAYARTGYHRGLDALRRAGWRGAGPVPWSHEPNRGFLRALAALARAAVLLGEDEEAQRCSAFLSACDPDASARLAGEARSA